MQTDVDIKRLWKAMPQNDIVAPNFDGQVIEEVAGTVCVIATNSGSIFTSIGQYATVYKPNMDAAFGPGTVTLVGATAGFPGGFTLNDYSLVMVFHNSSVADITAYPEIDASAVVAWLLANKQRRFVLMSSTSTGYTPTIAGQINSYLASLGSGMSCYDATMKTFLPASGTGSSSGHYLASAFTASGAGQIVGGGTPMFSVPDTDEGSRQIMAIESTGIGSELIFSTDSNFSSATNLTFAKGLFPTVLPGGIPVP